MPEIITTTQPTNTPRILTALTIGRALQRHQLPFYSGRLWSLAQYLRETHEWGQIAQLWREVFDEGLETNYLLDAQAEFVQRVDRELFPVELECMDEICGYDGENPLNYPIFITTYGVPYEVGFEEVLQAHCPLLAAMLVAGCSLEIPDTLPVWEWWASVGYPDPDELPREELAWLANNSEQARILLRSLNPPLNGLATLYGCIAKDTDNLFLEIPDGPWQGEYWDMYDAWYWSPGEIRALAKMFAAVREDVERLKNYLNWYYEGRNREIIQTLLKLGEGGNG